MKNTDKIVCLNSKLSELSKLADRMNYISDSVLSMIESHKRIISSIPTIEIPKLDIPNMEIFKLNIPEFNLPKLDFINSELLETLKWISETGEKAENSPELQFAYISDLEILNLKSAEEFKASLTSDLADEDIKEKEELLNKNLLPYLEELGIDNLWIGANKVLESKSNPDKLRHCLISLRTILEYLIDEKLAPIEKLKDAKMFENEFKKYNLGRKKLEFVKIKREQKIEYFTSKVDFGILENFTKNEIQYVCDCYSVLCNIHQPDIGITENQVRSFKVKTGITIWLLAYLYKIIKE
ncbi:hypothetical protein Q4534_14155 [Cyclobacterium sp. 1_MG-2023]|uniref:pPIWI-associating nuclease domain-containing protein n=1 Tax=Cyclobacterium sp. 1_MG-2023 TaxID=3062681 RepID=UPI0026E36E31|nr:hypothetical protein [Cyclobacterium sp. 1_MG-2023]MDO6438562.1 hypothetical protein [Cyclobacterium sp. 1_MG-2023]